MLLVIKSLHHPKLALFFLVALLRLHDALGGNLIGKFFPHQRLGQRRVQLHRRLNREFPVRPLDYFVHVKITVNDFRPPDNQNPVAGRVFTSAKGG